MRTTLIWLVAGGGSLVPGFAYFTTFPPPLFPPAAYLTSFLAGAILILVASRPLDPQKAAVARRKAARLIACAVLLLVAYTFLWQAWTIADPQTGETRYQIGFRRADRSLTGVGIQEKRMKPSAPLEEWMLDHGAFRKDGPEIIWTVESIYFAGGVLVLLYFLGFSSWTRGFALLAKAGSPVTVGRSPAPEAGRPGAT